MSFKSKAEIRTYEKDGMTHIGDIVLSDVRFNYTFLEQPRPPMSGQGEGQYETQIILNTQEAWEEFYKYYSQVYEEAVVAKWKNRRPEIGKMNVPFTGPVIEADGEYAKFHEDAVAVIRTRVKEQPKLYLRMPGEPLREASQDGSDEGQFYSGMIGEAVISLWAYAQGQYSPRDGIKAFLNAVCKTDVGEPIVGTVANIDYMGAFAGAGDKADTNVTAFTPAATQAQTPATPPAPTAVTLTTTTPPTAQTPKVPPTTAATPVTPTTTVTTPALNQAMATPPTPAEVPTEQPSKKPNLNDLLKKVNH